MCICISKRDLRKIEDCIFVFVMCGHWGLFLLYFPSFILSFLSFHSFFPFKMSSASKYLAELEAEDDFAVAGNGCPPYEIDEDEDDICVLRAAAERIRLGEKKRDILAAIEENYLEMAYEKHGCIAEEHEMFGWHSAVYQPLAEKAEKLYRQAKALADEEKAMEHEFNADEGDPIFERQCFLFENLLAEIRESVAITD